VLARPVRVSVAAGDVALPAERRVFDEAVRWPHLRRTSAECTAFSLGKLAAPGRSCSGTQGSKLSDDQVDEGVVSPRYSR
jgi:hypothetical protein